MSVTHIGTIRPHIYDSYVRERGCTNTTFIVPRDTDALARLVERVVEPGDLVLDLGCGDGIATLHAVAAGAASVVGVDVNPAAVATARDNARRVYPRSSLVAAGLQTRPQQVAGAIHIEQIDMRAVLTDPTVREALLRQCDLGGRTIDVVISNPPYVPMDGTSIWEPEDRAALRALPATDLGVLGRSDVLLERVATLRTAMLAAEDGGVDGLRFVRELLTHAPGFAARMAWLQGSYTTPLAVLELLEQQPLRLDRLLVYATPFGPTTRSSSASQAHLDAMRARGEAFFWSGSPDGRRWMLLLGFSLRRDARHADGSRAAVHASLRELLETFTTHGPASLARWSGQVPFEMEVGGYDA